ncbi:MAG: acyclic terpene utilization AtuA family protein [Stenotrophomonas sp.]
MAPMMYEFGWDALDHEKVGAGSAIGHLMECGAQITGGYFSDPGFKDVPEPWNFAFPIAEVDADGSVVISKVAGSGGAITLQTVKEQMLYEVHDPANYFTPDVVVDFTQSRLEQIAPDRVRVTGLTGKPRTPTLKVSMGCTEGFIGEDMFFYAGPGALRRAQLAKKILEERFKIVNLKAEDIRVDFLGLNAIHGAATPANAPEPYEIAVRVAARTKTREEAMKVGREVDGMAVSGVAHTGKRVPHQDRTREVIGVWSSLVPREQVIPQIDYFLS